MCHIESVWLQVWHKYSLFAPTGSECRNVVCHSEYDLLFIDLDEKSHESMYLILLTSNMTDDTAHWDLTLA